MEGEARRSVKLVVLGSGDAMGSGGRHFPAFVLTDGRRHLLLDCGPSALPSMKAAGLDPLGVETILISHLHGDHFGGIPSFFLDYQFLSNRDSPLCLIGPPGLKRRCETLIRVFYPEILQFHSWRFPREFNEMQPGQTLTKEDLRIEALEMDHGTQGPSLGYRVHWLGRLVSYTGDTRWNDQLVDLAEGSDLFLCECFFYDSDLAAHVRYRDLLEHRDRLKTKRVLLWHLGPEMLMNLERVDMEIARDGMVLEII